MEYFTTLVNTTLNDLSANPFWALALIFGVSLGEALLIIGLFVPSTVVLVTAGTLVGAGKLGFWPVMGATIFGCILGDQLSFWAGRWYGERLKTMWPLRNFPVLMAKGEEYVKEHGGKSIAIGRFIPGIKAVVPGIAGMFGMSQMFFLIVNLISGAAWGAAHVLPGILLGQALSFAGELSGRLLFALLVLFGILAVGGWLIRLAAGITTPHRTAFQQRLSDWAQTSRFPALRRMGLVLAPENPNSILILFSIMAGLLALVGLVDLVSGLIIHQAVGDFDQALFNFFAELRSVPGDELFVRLSMLGDERVLYAIAAVPVIWLALVGRWRASWIVVASILLAKAIIFGFYFAIPPQTTGIHPMAFRFPSNTALMAGTVYGTLGICCARGLSRWSQALVISCFAMLVIAIAFSRLYLGASWFSDVAGGVLIAAIIVVMFALAISTVPFPRFKPMYLLSTSFLVMVVAASIHITHNFDRQVERYQPQNRFVAYSVSDYLERGWSKQPSRRINIMGRATDDFVIQWVGSLSSLEAALQQEHYTIWNRWGWKDLIPYLNERAKINEIAPRPIVHAGLRAKLTATLISPDAPDAPDQRFVLRAFQSNAMLTANSAVDRIYLIYIRQEAAHSNLGLYSLPADHSTSPKDIAAIISALQANPSVETLAVKEKDSHNTVILKPKS